MYLIFYLILERKFLIKKLKYEQGEFEILNFNQKNLILRAECLICS